MPCFKTSRKQKQETHVDPLELMTVPDLSKMILFVAIMRMSPKSPLCGHHVLAEKINRVDSPSSNRKKSVRWASTTAYRDENYS